jgi:hypothetical protein
MKINVYANEPLGRVGREQQGDYTGVTLEIGTVGRVTFWTSRPIEADALAIAFDTAAQEARGIALDLRERD